MKVTQHMQQRMEVTHSITERVLKLQLSIRRGKLSQKHNDEYLAELWCLLAIENYMFRPIAAINRG
jgi:hypothetical protein